MRYRSEVDAFQYLGMDKIHYASYPDWFRERVEAGEVVPCGSGMHLTSDAENGHFEEGDWIAISLAEASDGLLFVFDDGVIGTLYEKVTIQ